MLHSLTLSSDPVSIRTDAEFGSNSVPTSLSPSEVVGKKVRIEVNWTSTARFYGPNGNKVGEITDNPSYTSSENTSIGVAGADLGGVDNVKQEFGRIKEVG